ncbi:MAG: hypothetical protein IIY75_05770, partial [Erysipelotrichales bacterium]|nr:hypothetical protein [Erysipelotrichales bacterium]
MAAKKKTTTRKKAPAKKTVKSDAPKRKLNPEVSRYFISVILIAVGLIALLYKGWLGVKLTQVTMFLFGKFYIVVFLLMILYGIWLIFSMRYIDLSNRIYMGIVIAMIAILMLLAIPADHAVGKETLDAFMAKKDAIFTEGSNVNPLGGIIGAGLYFAASSLADYTGSLIIAGLLLLLSVFLIVDRKYFRMFGQKVRQGSIRTVEITKEKIQDIRLREQEARRPKEQVISLTKDQKMTATDIPVSEYMDMLRKETGGLITLDGQNVPEKKKPAVITAKEEAKVPEIVTEPEKKPQYTEADYFAPSQTNMDLETDEVDPMESRE